MAIFFHFPPISNHLHTLQVENCDSNSRLVVDEDDNGKFRLERVKLQVTQKGISMFNSRKVCCYGDPIRLTVPMVTEMYICFHYYIRGSSGT